MKKISFMIQEENKSSSEKLKSDRKKKERSINNTLFKISKNQLLQLDKFYKFKVNQLIKKYRKKTWLISNKIVIDKDLSWETRLQSLLERVKM